MPNLATPVVTQGPVTQSAPVNVGMGLTAAAVTNYGTQALTGDAYANAVAVALNALMQPLKAVFPILKRHEWAILAMLILGTIISYFVIQHGDTAKSFVDGAFGTIQALANYKADKASGLNILKPAED